jgi:hypothetical protein
LLASVAEGDHLHLPKINKENLHLSLRAVPGHGPMPQLVHLRPGDQQAARGREIVHEELPAVALVEQLHAVHHVAEHGGMSLVDVQLLEMEMSLVPWGKVM